MEWHRVAAIGEIQPGQPKIARVNGREIGVFFEMDRYFAILNYCPHFGAPICLGHVFGAVVSDEPGRQSYNASRPILRCPWHRWEFDMETGVALTPIKERIKTYAVHVEAEAEGGCNGRCAAGPPALGGVANSSIETFGIKLEGGGIWVQMSGAAR